MNNLTKPLTAEQIAERDQVFITGGHVGHLLATLKERDEEIATLQAETERLTAEVRQADERANECLIAEQVATRERERLSDSLREMRQGLESLFGAIEEYSTGRATFVCCEDYNSRDWKDHHADCSMRQCRSILDRYIGSGEIVGQACECKPCSRCHGESPFSDDWCDLCRNTGTDNGDCAAHPNLWNRRSGSLASQGAQDGEADRAVVDGGWKE